MREMLEAAGLKPRKALGQNFLVDAAALAEIAAAAEIGPDDVILEIGPGPGLLTERLAGARRTVVACEIDRGLLALARERLPDRSIRWVEGDAIDGKGRLSPPLEAALSEATRGGRPWRLVSNLPYGISVPVTLLALSRNPAPRVAVVTVQREVGARFRARAATSSYGAVSVVARLLADAEVVRKLPPGAFWPRPSVHSTALRFRPRAGADRDLAASALFQRFARDAFAERRKQLAPRLASRSGGRLAARDAILVLASVGASPTARADALEPEILAGLFRTLFEPGTCETPDAPWI